MTNAPERIVIDHFRSNLWYTEEDAKWGPLDMTTYVRADRIKELEAENRELAMQLLATDGQAQEALERAVKAEADVTRAIQTALEMAADTCPYAIKSYEMLKPGKKDQFASRESQIVARGFVRLVEEDIRAIRVEDVLKKLEEKDD